MMKGGREMAYTRAQFIEIIGPMAQENMKKTGILASVTIAQACLESNNGNSGLTVKANNLFGNKGDYKEGNVTMSTTEYDRNNKAYVTQAKFRKYPSWIESLEDHSSLFNRLERYVKLRGIKDYKLACKYLGESGYATDPNYAQKLISIIEANDLTRYDDMLVNTVDELLFNALSIIIKSGISLNTNQWKRMDLMNLKNVPSLLSRLGGIEKLVEEGVITQKDIWEQGSYNKNHVRSLLIKYAMTKKV